MKIAAMPGLLLSGALLLSAPLGAILATARAAGPQPATFAVLHSFAGSPDGATPFGGIIRDKAGNFYGTAGSGGAAASGGIVFELAKPAAAGGAWAEIVLHSFAGGTADGANPDAPLVMDAAGALYGTTQWGGQGGGYDGTIFRLVPPAAGQTAWAETVLYRFGAKGGASPVGALLIGRDGALYGTACGCGLGDASKGAVFRLAPPATANGAWRYQVIHAFTGGADGGLPHAGLTAGPDGKFYGTASAGGSANAGVVFSLAPVQPGNRWVETVLYSFSGLADGAYPLGGVARDAAGRLYATAQYGGNAGFGNGSGTVIQLTPPTHAETWTETTIYTFTDSRDGSEPGSTPLVTAGGTVLGTADFGGDVTLSACENFEQPQGCGVIFALTPPKAGQTAWHNTTLHAFNYSQGQTPWGGLYRDASGIYGTTELGGAAGSGTVFALSP
jgi:uncharacterized repeat protein (TIGR03803 family)